MASSPITSWEKEAEKLEAEKLEAVTGQILFSWVPKALWTVTAVMELKDA